MSHRPQRFDIQKIKDILAGKLNQNGMNVSDTTGDGIAAVRLLVRLHIAGVLRKRLGGQAALIVDQYSDWGQFGHETGQDLCV